MLSCMPHSLRLAGGAQRRDAALQAVSVGFQVGCVNTCTGREGSGGEQRPTTSLGPMQQEIPLRLLQSVPHRFLAQAQLTLTLKEVLAVSGSALIMDGGGTGWVLRPPE